MKIKVRKAKYSRRADEPLKFEELEIECSGSGTKEEPAIIDSISKFPEGNIEIIESDLYIIITNHNIKLLTLNYAKNIIIRNCKFNSLLMMDCEGIIIENTHSSFLKWFNNHKCLMKDSVTEEQFRLYKCSNNKFINCEFWNFFTIAEKHSRENKFENCDFSGTIFNPSIEAFEQIKKPTLNSRSTYSINIRSSIVEVNCIGSGTKENPYVIDNNSLKDLDVREIGLLFNRDYVFFKNFDLKLLKLYDTHHINLENCKISKICLLKFCVDITINFAFIKKLKFGACQDTNILNSEIKEIDTYKGYMPEGSKLKKVEMYHGYGEPIELRNCTYKKIKKEALQAINQFH
ncbi:MAG: hypothetical protein JSV62_14930 [Promethearchaeota archaeon]|nr:MAG: hypothetical protein JSV62_14930 [Candidatus Lokiarchaeota archaeon]